jgi:hypothetical protein
VLSKATWHLGLENELFEETLAAMETRLAKYETMMLAILEDLPENKMVNIGQLMSDDVLDIVR